MRKTTEGKCLFCGETFSEKTIKGHLENCKVKNEEYTMEDADKSEKYFCLLAQGYENPEYWIYIDIPASSTFQELDDFLRDIWLECCGHLSLFEIRGETFSSSPDREFGDKNMNIKLKNIFEMGMQFKYEYDFGSTTTLKLKVVSEFCGSERNKKGKKVRLLARNNQPDIKCSHCGKPATNVCCQCIYDDNGWVCDNCADNHKCGEDMLLPVVNSPRVGICAYNGGSYDE